MTLWVNQVQVCKWQMQLLDIKMPRILDRLVKQLKDKGYNKKASFAIATKKLQQFGNLKKGTNKPTLKGIKRGNMTPAQRAIDRASKKLNKPKTNFVYNKNTNRATLKNKRI